MDKKLMTPHEVAALLKVPIRGIYRLIQEGQLNSIRIGRRIRFNETEVQKLLEGRNVKTEVAK